MGELEVRLLGPFEVVVGGNPVDVPGAKRQALVACLALRTGRVVPTDTLVEALWGSDLPSAPRNAVQHHVTRLRRALGADTIRLAADGYALEGRGRRRHASSRSCSPLHAALCAPATRVAQRTRSPTRSPSGAGLRCWACLSRRGRPPRPGRLDALRLDALEERFEAALALGEHADLGTRAYALRWTRARSASGSGGS